MPATVQILRTATANLAPTSLLPGQLAIEMASVPPKLWCGVDTAIDATGMKMLLPTTGGVTVADAPPATPMQGDLWWNSTATQLFVSYNDGTSQQWVQANTVANPTQALPFVRLSGDTMTGPLTLSGPPTVGLHAATKDYADLMLPLTAGMTKPLTGDLVIENASVFISHATSAAFMFLGRPAGQQANISGGTGSLTRWSVILGGTEPETGSNVGADFAIVRSDDLGVQIDSPLTISRANGSAGFTQDVYIHANGVSYPKFSPNTIGFGWVGTSMKTFIDGTDSGYAILSNPGGIVAGATPLERITLDGAASLMYALYIPSGTGNWVTWPITFSDRRVKTDIQPATLDALDVVNRLPVHDVILTPPLPGGVPQHWDCSLIADEVAPLIPAAYVAASEGSYETLRELPIIATLVRALQQVTMRLEALEGAR